MQTCHNKIFGEELADYDKKVISIVGQPNLRGTFTPSPAVLTSGVYFLELGKAAWDCDITVAAGSHTVLVLTIPAVSEEIHTTLEGKITIAERANCTIVYANYSMKSSIESRLEYHLEEKSSLTSYYLLSLKGDEDFQELFFLQKNAQLSIKSLVIGAEDEKKVFRPKVCHLESQSLSQTTVRSLLKGRARASLSALIDVRPGASCDAHYHNKNLLLSPHASVSAEPQLAIFFDELACSHGVAIGPLDLEQVLYLRARGISEIEARRLILQAFASEILQDFPREAKDFIEHFYQHDMLEAQ